MRSDEVAIFPLIAPAWRIIQAGGCLAFSPLPPSAVPPWALHNNAVDECFEMLVTTSTLLIPAEDW